MTLGDGNPKPDGTWDYWAEYAPGTERDRNFKTFTVSVFQWRTKAGGKGTKKGSVLWSVRGTHDNPQEAYDKAIAQIRRFEEVDQWKAGHAKEQEKWIQQ